MANKNPSPSTRFTSTNQPSPEAKSGPKGKCGKDVLNKFLLMTQEELVAYKPKDVFEQGVIAKMLKFAKGDDKSFDQVMDRTEGKPVQPTKMDANVVSSVEVTEEERAKIMAQLEKSF